MNMSSRDLARQLIVDISVHDLDATFRVKEPDKLLITGKLTSELTSLIKQYKADLIDYLTTPPDTVGICRGGHKIDWKCSQYGLWLCSCYFGQKPVEDQKPQAKHVQSSLKGYWQQAI